MRSRFTVILIACDAYRVTANARFYIPLFFRATPSVRLMTVFFVYMLDRKRELARIHALRQIFMIFIAILYKGTFPPSP